MNDQAELLDIDLCETCEHGYAGEWLPLKLLLRCPPSSASEVVVKLITCREKDVQFNTDLLQGDIAIRPGEAYRLTVPMCVPTPRLLNLGDIVLQVARPGARDELAPLPSKPLPIHPAIGKEVKVHLESLCAYSEGTKTRLSLSHQGRTRFDDFTVTVGPSAAIAAGKQVFKSVSFGPESEEQLEIVIASDHVDIELSGKVDGRETTFRLNQRVPRVGGRRERRFRFLEPRRLSLDQKSISEVESGRLVEPLHAAYPLYIDQRYRIVIRPQVADVSEVILHDIPGVMHVRKRDTDSGKREWTFLVDLSGKRRWSQPERLFYDVVTPQERLTGEIHVCLKPPRFTYATLAMTLGIALTMQGIGALARFVFKPEFSLGDALDHFHFGSDYQILFLLFIPVVLGGLACYDWLQYRLRG